MRVVVVVIKVFFARGSCNCATKRKVSVLFSATVSPTCFATFSAFARYVKLCNVSCDLYLAMAFRDN